MRVYLQVIPAECLRNTYKNTLFWWKQISRYHRSVHASFTSFAVRTRFEKERKCQK